MKIKYSTKLSMGDWCIGLGKVDLCVGFSYADNCVLGHI